MKIEHDRPHDTYIVWGTAETQPVQVSRLVDYLQRHAMRYRLEEVQQTFCIVIGSLPESQRQALLAQWQQWEQESVQRGAKKAPLFREG